MREPTVTSDPEVGTILIRQDGGAGGGEQQVIEVAASMVPHLISQLFTAAVCVGAGIAFPPPAPQSPKAMN